MRPKTANSSRRYGHRLVRFGRGVLYFELQMLRTNREVMIVTVTDAKLIFRLFFILVYVFHIQDHQTWSFAIIDTLDYRVWNLYRVRRSNWEANGITKGIEGCRKITYVTFFVVSYFHTNVKNEVFFEN